MNGDGKPHVSYSPLQSSSSSPPPPRTGRCLSCETPRSGLSWKPSFYRLLAIVLVLLGVFTLVIYQSIWHTRQPPDVFLELTEEEGRLPGDEQDEVWDKIRIKHTKRRLPQCIIIGIRKAGTRALLTFLNLHPQIQAAKNEVHFFDEDENYERGYEWYRKRMPYSFSGQLTIEKSPSYFKVREVPGRIQEMNSSIKLLLIVREPTERMISDYLQIQLKRIKNGKSAELFEVLATTSDGEVDEDYGNLRLSLYYKHMRNWLKYFTLDHFHIVDGNKLTKDPINELHKVEDFLGLEHRLNSDMFYYNKTKKHFCYKLATEQKCLDATKGREHPEVDPNVLRKLREYFRPYNEKFFEMIGRRFDWPAE